MKQYRCEHWEACLHGTSELPAGSIHDLYGYLIVGKWSCTNGLPHEEKDTTRCYWIEDTVEDVEVPDDA